MNKITAYTIISILLISAGLLVFLNTKPEASHVNIVNTEDIQPYLTLNNIEEIEQKNAELSFWIEKENTNSSHIYQTQLANIYSSLFDITGDVQYINNTENLLLQANENSHDINVGTVQALAANAITQHEFQKAYEYANSIINIKDNKYGTYLILYDACMELGYYEQAEVILKETENKLDFNYLVRLSKWKDYVGDLDSAVLYMETAYSKIATNDKNLQTWSLSNLADMYGHQGKVEKSYTTFLEVLEIDPHYHYALKGISYIAYAHDNNTSLAKDILIYLDNNSKLPDYKLMLAEIEGFDNNEEAKTTYIEYYYVTVSNPMYGNMYNTYVMSIEAEEYQNYEKAIAMAKNEVEQRATPETYDILAWNYYLKGDKETALQISQEYVEGKTYEPNAIYHLGVLYSEIDDKKSKAYLEEAYDATFELGPSVTKEIEQLL